MISDNEDPQLHEIAVWFARYASPTDCYRAFEAYGHAMTVAVTFEMLMALMIAKAMLLRIGKRTAIELQQVDQPALTRTLLSSTYDKLQRKLRNCYDLSEELTGSLNDGKNARDHLAHNFWQGNATNLLSAEGVDVIATQCWHYANHFRLLADALTRETGINVDDYILMLRDDYERSEKLSGWQELLARDKFA